MKRIVYIVLMFAVCPGIIVAQAVPQGAGDQIVGSGCVGECDPSVGGGESATIHYKVEGDRNVTMILRTTGTGLCKDSGVYAFLFRNGKVVANGHITSQGDSIQAKASPGDKIVAYCFIYPLFNDILCIRLGELRVDLIKNSRKSSNYLP
ncbi:MAG: hypothetical protein MUF15_13410 [Acidobacteria bacterium]|jgi:hypothetical protein|nr:hypothetical protein [Acidobacteriota bacterium]